MRILSMTATFGKLEHSTLTLQPGLNILEAPNEWGKSTWCAFLCAMLYGIETRVHTTKTALADKDRFAPWSGSPMSGRIDLEHEGRFITIERSTKGRSVFGQFRAYETDTGLEIPELTAANCGQQLLGVEKSVFLRTVFVRLADLPVTQDEALRRRLNAMVTTGDESGTADTLSQKLRDLKNRCRLNRSTGLLPQLEAQRAELEEKLARLAQLQHQSEALRRQQQQLEQYHRALKNHEAALAYADSLNFRDKLSQAEAALETAAANTRELELTCQALPSGDELRRTAAQFQRLRQELDAVHMEVRMQPAEPEKPEAPFPFRGLSPEDALTLANRDFEEYRSLSRKRTFPWYWIVLALLGIPALLISHWAVKLLGALLILAGSLLLGVSLADRRRSADKAQALALRYRPIPAESWVTAAQDYSRELLRYRTEKNSWDEHQAALGDRRDSLNRQIVELTGGRTLAECEQACGKALEAWDALADARREQQRAEDLVRTLKATHRQAPLPTFEDTMTHTAQDTARLLSDCAYELRQTEHKLGSTQALINALGSEAALTGQLDALNTRIAALEDTYAALELAQTTLVQATAELQRRFAPRITSRAKEIFHALTEGRYDRLTLGSELDVQAGAQNEDTLRGALWRSEGTVDQLYLSLRLAMAGELTPDAPLILDDALVRFDEARLAAALKVLEQEAKGKQVILFSCRPLA